MIYIYLKHNEHNEIESFMSGVQQLELPPGYIDVSHIKHSPVVGNIVLKDGSDKITGYGPPLFNILDCPSPFHTFDKGLMKWVADIEAARSSLIDLVNKERDIRGKLPITYMGSLYDADDKANRNINAWVMAIKSGAELPTPFVWRDFNNVDHPASLAMLEGIATTITKRGTVLYYWSWQQKEAIKQLPTIEAILSYKIV